MNRCKIFRYLVYIIYILASPAYAQDEWDRVRSLGLKPGVLYTVQSGTGFFVNRNYIITNAHVLGDCLTVSVRGAVNPSAAKLIASDNNLDLAILYNELGAASAPNLRENLNLKAGEPVFVMGYPLNRGETGEYSLVPANVIGFEDLPPEKARHIEFTNSVEHGNSGGPLLDRAGNVAGVVVAKKLTTVYELSQSNGAVTNTETSTSSVAIPITVLRNYLNQHHINYYSTNTPDILTNFHPDRLAKEFIVNVHCVKEDDKPSS